MTNNKKISVIMLVYNTGKNLLDKSIGSLLNQTYKNLEIILLDDCSTSEETVKTLKAYEEQYENIKVVKHENNYGMLRGRITGFKNSTGDYIAYLDSDDTASLDFYRTLLETSEENQADIVVSPFNLENEKGEKKYYTRCPFRNKIFNLEGEDIIDTYMSYQGKCFSCSLVWNKLYRRDLIENALETIENFSLENTGLNMCEDIAFTFPIFMKAKHLVSCQGEAINYYKHSAASTSVNNKKKFLKSTEDIGKVFSFIDKTIKEKNLPYKQDFESWKNHYYFTYINFASTLLSKGEAKEYLLETFDIVDVPKAYGQIEDYFYNDVAEITVEEKNKEDIIKKIMDKNIKVVSFDVFDTLIMRNLYEPTDVFGFLNIEFNKMRKSSYMDFSRIRIDAERNVRKVYKREITLDEIYDYIEKTYLISNELCVAIKAKEIELEHKFMVARKFGKKLYNIAKLCGKKVVCISDMYLDAKTIGKLLTKCGYDEDICVYVSSEFGKTKHQGSLYKYVLKELNVKANQVLHIGDNKHSDLKMAEENGVNAFLLPQTNVKYQESVFKTLFQQNNQYIEVFEIKTRLLMRSMFGLIKNRLFDNPFVGFEEGTIANGQPGILGYSVVGMELVALTNWLAEKVKDSKKIHFVARDGYLPMLAYEELKKYNKELPQSNYFYISRKALLLLDVKSQEDLATLDVKMNVENLSVKKIAENFGLDIVNIEKLKLKAKQNKISYEEKFENKEEFYLAIKLFDDEVVNYKKHNEYCKTVVENFKKEITPNNKFFDIGYSGRAESIMCNLLGYPIDSLYVHTNHDVPMIRAKIGGFKIETFLGCPSKVIGHIREHIFMKSAPSLVKYELIDNKIKHVFEESKVDRVTEIATSLVQESAINFVKDFYQNFYEYMDWLAFLRDYATFPYERYLNDPPEKDKQIFSCVMFEDDMGLGRDYNLMEIWKTGIPDNLRYVSGSTAALKVVNIMNKLLPIGSKRRAFVAKIYRAHNKRKQKRLEKKMEKQQ